MLPKDSGQVASVSFDFWGLRARTITYRWDAAAVRRVRSGRADPGRVVYRPPEADF
jgi:hypothetical protein